MKRLYLNISNTVDFLLIVGNVGITGQTVTLNIRRNSDTAPKKWWDGNSWETTKTALSMTEFDSTNCKGLYTYEWTPDGAGSYTLTYTVSGTYATDISETVLVDYDVDAIDKYAIEYDFTTYGKSVMLFYDDDRTFSTDPVLWCYVYTASGGRPVQASEIAKRDRVNTWSSGQPV